MRILVMGAGAIGSVVGGFLAKAGHEVHLVGRAAHMQAIRDGGLRIGGIWGEQRVENLHCAASPEEVAARGFDCALVTVKSYQTPEAIRAIAPLLDENTLVFSYQNGLGNAEEIAAVVGWPRTVGVRAIYGVRVEEPGACTVTVIAQPTAIGPYHGDTPVARVRAVVDAMQEAGLPTVYTDEIATALWAKVAYNCALNPMSALLDVPYGRLAEIPETRDALHDLVYELYAVAGAEGVALKPGTPAAYMRLFFGELLPPTAAHYASMREDLQLGRRTEIDALNGAIARLGAKNGIPCHANEALTRLVHAREALAEK